MKEVFFSNKKIPIEKYEIRNLLSAESRSSKDNVRYDVTSNFIYIEPLEQFLPSDPNRNLSTHRIPIDDQADFFKNVSLI